ncbi:MAG: hypothetical protein A2099_05800 [Planctomycetes bacterium GWF2_39_10]|nr:MAG: hypothetical protein A2099_05800 [Planctomycetes bacterium GWF2_39_10]
MEMVIKKPDILEIFSKEGISLQQRGRYLWALCPFHSEKTPSFCVNPEKQSFKCYGCGKYGDAIDFVQHYKSLSFKDTLVYLGISSNGQAKSNPLETRGRELIEKFKEWCCNYTKYLCERLRVCNQIDSLVKTSDDLEIKGLSEMYLLRDVYQYHLSILNNREDETKFKLYEEVCYGNRNRENRI